MDDAHDPTAVIAMTAIGVHAVVLAWAGSHFALWLLHHPRFRQWREALRRPKRAPAHRVPAAGKPQLPPATSKHEAVRRRREPRPTGPLRVPTPLSDDTSLTDAIALDCEMVGAGPRGLDSILASVCVVNRHGNVLYYAVVAPTEPVTDYRTQFSGITAEMLREPSVKQFEDVRAHVKELCKDRVVVGHGIDNDFLALAIHPQWTNVRDTAFDLRRLREGSRPRKLKTLAADHLGLKIQRGPHDPAEDARAAMYLYLRYEDEFEEVACRRAARAARRAERQQQDSAERVALVADDDDAEP